MVRVVTRAVRAFGRSRDRILFGVVLPWVDQRTYAALVAQEAGLGGGQRRLLERVMRKHARTLDPVVVRGEIRRLERELRP